MAESKVFTAVILAAGFASFCATPAMAASVSVAVAANFTKVAEELNADFMAKTGDEAVLSFSATGQLYTQISQGAPFEVFLAADDERPAKAVAENLGVEGSVFTYAVGTLVLYSTSIDVSVGADALKGDYEKLAIGDPETAPYGRAAIETLAALDLTEATKDKLVVGENITQTLQFVESGNAQLGFVASSQVLGKTYQWAVPAELHEPIRQDAVLLKTGENNPVAVAFVEYLKSAAAIAIIEKAGYSVD